MKRSLRLILVLVLVLTAVVALVPAPPANAAICDTNPEICAPLRKLIEPYYRSLLCQIKVLSCERFLEIIWSTPQPNADCNQAMRYADTPPATETELRWAEFAVVCLVNQERTNRQLNPLQIDDRLMRAAREHALCIVANNPDRQVHDSAACGTEAARARTAGYSFRWLAANAFPLRGGDNWLSGDRTCGPPNGRIDTAPRDAVIGWMCSDGHEENILDTRMRDTGVAAVFGSYRAGQSDMATSGERYPPVTYVQIFAQPL